MSDNRKQWFLVRRRGEVFATYQLYFGRTVKEIRETFMLSKQTAYVTPMSWRGLHELTGCNIPCGKNGCDKATSGLMFQRDGRNITIHA